MADATEGNTDIQSLGLLVPTLITLTAGLVIHSFIIGVNVTDWWKGRPVTPVDHIVTSLGVSKMGTQCIHFFFVFMDQLQLGSLYSRVTVFILILLYDFLTFANFWLTSLLSIVFCLKISNLHSRLFLYLRGLIAHRTVYFIVATVLLSVFNCLMSFVTVFTNMIKGGRFNTTMSNQSMGCILNNYIYSNTIGTFFPLLLYCISAIFLFTSLYHHTSKMKKSSNLSINLETYYSVMRFISFTFIYNTVYIMGHFACICYYFFYCVFLLWLHTVLEFLPALHSSYLIYRTPKLRSWMSKGLQSVTDFLCQRKDIETRENIEVVAV